MPVVPQLLSFKCEIAKIKVFTLTELTLRQLAVLHLMDLRQHLPENKRIRIKQTKKPARFLQLPTANEMAWTSN
jgi:hypothetical protein